MSNSNKNEPLISRYRITFETEYEIEHDDSVSDKEVYETVKYTPVDTLKQYAEVMSIEFMDKY